MSCPIISFENVCFINRLPKEILLLILRDIIGISQSLYLVCKKWNLIYWDIFETIEISSGNYVPWDSLVRMKRLEHLKLRFFLQKEINYWNRNFHNLKTLSITNCRFEFVWNFELIKNVETLTFFNCFFKADTPLKGLENLPKLKNLCLSKSRQLKEEDFITISKCINLIRLYLWCVNCSDYDIEKLVTLQNLTELDLCDNEYITKNSLKIFIELESLQKIDLRDTNTKWIDEFPRIRKKAKYLSTYTLDGVFKFKTNCNYQFK